NTSSPLSSKSGARSAIQNDVTVRSRFGGITRVEMRGHRPAPDDADIARQVGVGAQCPPARTSLRVSVEMRHLPPCVHTGVRTPGANGADGLRGNAAERAFDSRLDRGG